jgi:hypothetical protein
MIDVQLLCCTSGCTLTPGSVPADIPTAFLGSASNSNIAADIWLRPGWNAGWISMNQSHRDKVATAMQLFMPACVVDASKDNSDGTVGV